MLLLAASQSRHRRVRKCRAHAAKRGKAAFSRGKTVSFIFVTAGLVAVFAEGLLAIALRFVEGEWPYSRLTDVNYLLFETHPDWEITPRKSVTIAVMPRTGATSADAAHVFHHNTDGFRGKEFASVKADCRVACIGGSATYCIGVSDNETWPFYLDQLLQPDCEILNFGVPGHSSVEHKKLLPRILARYSPDLVVFQMGLNDLRNMNLVDPGADYENFHQPSLRFSVTGVCRRERLPPIGLVQAGVVLLTKLNVLSHSPFPPGEPAGHVSDSVDPRVVEIFSANLEILLRECRAKHVRVVLLPHALSPEVITDTNYQWWAPYLTKKGIFNALDALNAVMRRSADGDWVIYARFMDGAVWGPEEFCDPSHLSANGNRRLARLLEERLPWGRLLGAEGRFPK